MNLYRSLRITLALAAGMLLNLGCGHTADSVLGTPPSGAATAAVREINVRPASSVVTVHGEMIEKCPVAGCWFLLRDNTGVVRVDTKAAGFVVSDVPLHTVLLVRGKTLPGPQPGMAAIGVRY